ncbi:hypothetical protein [Clostridium butyricum]
MNPQQIMDEIQKCRNDLSRLNENLKNFGIQREKTERVYRIELSKMLLKLRLEKIPSNIVQDVAKGDERISLLRMNKGLADNSFITCQEALRNKRLELETLRSLLTWERTELQSS